MVMLMAPRYFIRVIRLLAKHPSAVFLLPRGGESVGAGLLDMMAQDFLKHPVESIRVKGFTIYLNPADGYVSGQIAGEHACEAEVTNVFERVLAEAKVVVDAGANIGWYTLLAATKLGSAGIVLSFEPEALNFSYLSKSVGANGLTNVRLFETALSASIGDAILHLSPDSRNPGMHSISVDFHVKDVPVRTTTLDAVTAEFGLDSIDVLKLDVEYAEPLVLHGAERLLNEGLIRNIFMEWTPSPWKQEASLLALIEQKYDVFQLKMGNQVRTDFTSLPQRVNLFMKLKRAT
jgi:FkbM family methyltransferase